MTLEIYLRVKFRAFLITFADWDKNFSLPIIPNLPRDIAAALAVSIPVAGKSLLNFTERGVTLRVAVKL